MRRNKICVDCRGHGTEPCEKCNRQGYLAACPTCHGKGSYKLYPEEEDDEPCEDCDGYGQVSLSKGDISDDYDDVTECSDCRGECVVSCRFCKGRGVVPKVDLTKRP